MPSPMPATASASASMRWWVVLAGWITSDFASPMFARWENSDKLSMKARPAARPPFNSKLSTAPAPFGSRRSAKA